MVKELPRLKGEERYYVSVRKWLETKGYYCGGGMVYQATGRERWYVKTGIQNLRADVIGVRNVGNRFIDRIEIHAVEVKDEKRVTFRDLQQTYGYSTFAHRVSLATTAELAEEDKATASRMGIGLVRLIGRRAREVLSPGIMRPNEAEMLKLLNRLWIIRCSICNCFVFKWEFMDDLKGKSYHMFKRARQVDHMRDSTRKATPFAELDRNELETRYVIERYICRTCADQFGLLLRKQRSAERAMG